MDPVFTIPFSEYETLAELKKNLGKGYSFYVPASRQQKGIDFIIHNDISNKHLRFQVKGSRSYHETRETIRNKRRKMYSYHFWYGNFIDRYNKGNADYYILFGLYPKYSNKVNIKTGRKVWKSLILCFTEKEMFRLLRSIRTTGKETADRFFVISFDDPNTIFGSRGFLNDVNVTRYLLINKLPQIIRRLR